MSKYLHIRIFYCTFAAQNGSFVVFLLTSREVCPKRGRGYGHIGKGVFSALFWLLGISQIR